VRLEPKKFKRHRGALRLTVRKRLKALIGVVFLSIKKMTICQARLGTNVRELEGKRKAFLSLQVHLIRRRTREPVFKKAGLEQRVKKRVY
jgi:hypothetical protein